jgi:hypothetical protein
MSSNFRACLRTALAVSAVLFVLSWPVPSSAGKSPDASSGDGGSGAKSSDQWRIPFPKPGSHDGNWIIYHGKSFEGKMTGVVFRDNECVACHARNDCTACHATQAPRDHTNTWRTLIHGSAADGNRERCATCHRQDYCVRCHDETAPRSHRGNWINTHCAWCHYGPNLRPADSCGVCHRVAAHMSAPHPINPGLDCALCHP